MHFDLQTVYIYMHFLPIGSFHIALCLNVSGLLKSFSP